LKFLENVVIQLQLLWSYAWW